METIFIPKPGKENYNTAGMFRPITLSSFLLKCLEKIIKAEWKDSFLTTPFQNQHGFTESRSCDTALSSIVDKIEQGINKKGNICIAVFLDIQGAFDNVQFSSIKRELVNRGASKETIDWYCQLLENRKITTNLKGKSYTICPMQGAPQGDPLSDCIWNIVYQPIIDKISKSKVLPIALADDITLLHTGDNPDQLLLEVQQVINDIITWGENEKLNFNAKKAVMVFSRKPGFHNKELLELDNLMIRDEKLKFVDETRSLGVTLDNKLNWNSHLSNKINKCKKDLMTFRNLVKLTEDFHQIEYGDLGLSHQTKTLLWSKLLV